MTNANKLAMKQFINFINTADQTLGRTLVSERAIFHVPGRSEPLSGIEGYMEVIRMMRSGFPDIQWALEEMIAEGDTIAARFTMRGTHLGSIFGVPPSGNVIEVQALNIYKFKDGVIIEERGQPDIFALMSQIGAFSR